jgi:hypothetical protein
MDPEAVDQGPCRRVGVRIQALMRVPVSGEESFQAKGVRHNIQ